MIYYVMKGQTVTLFLSLLHLTSVNFEGKVYDYIGGQTGNFEVYQLNKKRSLVFRPKKKDFKESFIAYLKDSRVHFDLIYNEKFSPKDVEIREGRPCSYFTLIKETKEYQLFECPESLYLVDKSKNSKRYLSKGPPVYFKGKLIYHQELAL